MEWVVVAVYVGLHALLCVHGIHRAWLQLQLLRSDPVPVPPVPEAWPAVTVQLPVFNERNVIERIIEVAGQLDYPPELLEIQVLDDSTDDTTARAEVACRRLRERGIRAHVVHREDRTGFKAGALDHGLSLARADRIAIFDADFLPPADFLRRTVPYLEQGIGMVQARWGHLNAHERVHTLLQSVLLDGHFVVEQLARYRGRRWHQFNGTAGIWRRDTIEVAGGWEHDTLTEDLDLSYRAQIAGERFVYLPDLVCPAEVPPTMAAFKAQQHRWGKGMVQACKKSLGRILRSDARLGLKLESALHLTSVFTWPLVALVSVPLPLGIWARQHGLLDIHWTVDLALFLTATASILSFYAVAAIGARRRGLGWRLLAVPLAMSLGVGLAVAQCKAVWEGLFGEVGTFVRTPKRGDAGASSYLASIDWIVIVEALMAVWLLGSAAYGAWDGWIGAVPFLALFGIGYALLAGHTLAESLGRAFVRPPREAIGEAEAAGK